MPGIVIESARLVYWPIPKNACSAIKLCIVQAQGLRVPENGTVHDAAFTWTMLPLPGYRNVALVRHPLARLHSLWVNKIAKGHPMGSKYDKGLDVAVFGRWPGLFRSEMPFMQFASACLSVPPALADPHWAPQVGQIPLDQAPCELYRMDTLQGLLRLLAPQVNPGHLPQLKWREAYTPELRATASQYYKEDLDRLGFCNTLLIDADGVLTDGKMYIDHTGEKLFKAFHSRDTRALRQLVGAGWRVVVISADDWPGMHAYAEKVGVELLVERDKSKLSERFEDYMAIGDDAWDVPLLRNATRAFCPSDADLSVWNLSNIEVIDCAGGAGVIARLLPQIIKA